MSERIPQTYANHRKFVPGYHYVTFSLLAVNLVYQAIQLVRAFSVDRLMNVVLALGLFGVMLFARAFALRAQDRLIRLEERTRLARLLPADLAGRIEEIRPAHLVALRFASDEELPELARRVLAGELSKADDIKRAIRSWRADLFRV